MLLWQGPRPGSRPRAASFKHRAVAGAHVRVLGRHAGAALAPRRSAVVPPPRPGPGRDRLCGAAPASAPGAAVAALVLAAVLARRERRRLAAERLAGRGPGGGWRVDAGASRLWRAARWRWPRRP
ncbi:hypothetical protein LP419_21205 [Massilia sp. H-1]|nr:hypothetical protein LP419_21205 [Massilia sp. H-1]